jgi:hypothetical protein
VKANILGVMLILAGVLLIAYGANVLSLAVLPPTEITKDGITVKWSRPRDFAGDYAVQLTITVPKGSSALVWGDRIYVWVSREATFKAYDEVQKTWIYRVYRPMLWGPGGSVKLRPFSETDNYYVYSYNVDFESATSSWTAGLTSGWQFVQWNNKGTVVIGSIQIDFELPIPSQLPSTESTSQSQTETVTPQETSTTPPTETPDVTVSSTTQVKTLNYGYIFLGAVLCLAGLWTATKKPSAILK